MAQNAFGSGERLRIRTEIKYQGLVNDLSLASSEIIRELIKLVRTYAYKGTNAIKRLVRKRKSGRKYTWQISTQIGEPKNLFVTVAAEGGDRTLPAVWRSKPHQASAPGEAPATDTGGLISSIIPDFIGDFEAFIEVQKEYGYWLEFGTKFMEARPFVDPIWSDLEPDFEREAEELVRRLVV